MAPQRFVHAPSSTLNLSISSIHTAACFYNKSRLGGLIFFSTGLQPVSKTPVGFIVLIYLLNFTISPFIFIKLLFSTLFTLIFFSFLFFFLHAFFLNTLRCDYRSDESKQWILHSFWGWGVCKYPVIFPLEMLQSLGYVHQILLSHTVTISPLKCIVF